MKIFIILIVSCFSLKIYSEESQPVIIDTKIASSPFDYSAVAAALMRSRDVERSGWGSGMIEKIEPVLFTSVYYRDLNQVIEHVVCRVSMLDLREDPEDLTKVIEKVPSFKLVLLTLVKYQRFQIWKVDSYFGNQGTEFSILELDLNGKVDKRKISDFSKNWNLFGTEANSKLITNFSINDLWSSLAK